MNIEFLQQGSKNVDKLIVPGMMARSAEENSSTGRTQSGGLLGTCTPLNYSPFGSDVANTMRMKDLVPKTPSPVYQYEGGDYTEGTKCAPRFFPFPNDHSKYTIAASNPGQMADPSQMNAFSSSVAARHFGAVAGNNMMFNLMVDPQFIANSSLHGMHGGAPPMFPPILHPSPPAWVVPGSNASSPPPPAVSSSGKEISDMLAQVRRQANNGPMPSLSLGDVAPEAVDFAQDQFGSRFLQQSLESASAEERHVVFLSILPCTSKLTTDAFGNYVVQKLIDYLSTDNRRILAEQLLGDVLKLSLHMYGCRVIQKVIDSVDEEHQVLLASELKDKVVKCVEDQNGNHVIQKCIEKLHVKECAFIIDEFKNDVERMSLHCYGCRVVQRLIEKCVGTPFTDALIAEVMASVTHLCHDQYGNYVVQHVMQHGSKENKDIIVNLVLQNFVEFSCHKFASNVVEKALVYGSTSDRMKLMEVSLTGNPANCPLIRLTKDRFANYVVQRILEFCQGSENEAIRYRILEVLKPQIPTLKKSTFGKHIAIAIERLLNGLPIASCSAVGAVGRPSSPDNMEKSRKGRGKGKGQKMGSPPTQAYFPDNNNNNTMGQYVGFGM